MAKVRKCRLSWKPSDSDQVVGYRLYWSKGDTVSYDSNFFEVGNVSEVYLPDVLKLDPRYEVRLMLGVTAVDLDGNESDMATLAAPYQTTAPHAPAELLLTALDEFSLVGTSDAAVPGPMEKRFEKETQKDDLEELARIVKPLLRS